LRRYSQVNTGGQTFGFKERKIFYILFVLPPVSTTACVVDTGGKFAAGVNDAGGKLPFLSMTPAANLPPVSTTPLANNGNNIRLLKPQSAPKAANISANFRKNLKRS
jgi:hypothetical protein